MLTVTGPVFVTNTPSEHENKNGVYFNFVGVAPHPRKKGNADNPDAGRVFYKVNIFAFKNELESARKHLREGKVIRLRFGELDSTKTEKGTIFNEVRANWSWCQPVNTIS